MKSIFYFVYMSIITIQAEFLSNPFKLHTLILQLKTSFIYNNYASHPNGKNVRKRKEKITIFGT